MTVSTHGSNTFITEDQWASSCGISASTHSSIVHGYLDYKQIKQIWNWQSSCVQALPQFQFWSLKVYWEQDYGHRFPHVIKPMVVGELESEHDRYAVALLVKEMVRTYHGQFWRSIGSLSNLTSHILCRRLKVWSRLQLTSCLQVLYREVR